MSELLFVGGTADGKRLPVTKLTLEYKLPIPNDPISNSKLADTFGQPLSVEVQTYRLVLLRDEVGNEYPLYVLEEHRLSLIPMLLTGYRGKADLERMRKARAETNGHPKRRLLGP
jgi:hypothetical protein